MKKTKKGFTLVELLVVIAILAILSTIAVVGYTAFVDKANETKAKAELHQIVEYLDSEFIDDGKWGDLDKNTMTADELESAISNCEDLGQTVTVSIFGDTITISYTTNGVTVSKNLLN